MTGRLIVGAILLVALLAAAGLYYLQVYAFYQRLDAAEAQIALTPLAGGDPEPIALTDFSGIDADSSPIRYRACFRTDPGLLDGFAPYEGATPLTAPGWFSCFDARAIDIALKDGSARAFLAQKNIHYGVDRIVAVLPDGRAYAWHQLNDCGEKAYDGTPVGEECPPRPASQDR